jgi:hypothetical protein
MLGMTHTELPRDFEPLVVWANKESTLHYNEIDRHYSGEPPPGTPTDRVQNYRKAFLATLKDPQFLAEAEKRSCK